MFRHRKTEYQNSLPLNKNFYKGHGEKVRYERLLSIIKPCGNFGYYDGEDKEITAKQTLISFFKEFEKIKPSGVFICGIRREGYSFLINLTLFFRAVYQKRYCAACGELISLFVYEPILQPRIYYNLLYIYHNYLEE